MPKKVIQIPVDRDLLEALNTVSRQQAKSRSALIREACAQYIATAEKEGRIRQYVEGYRRTPETQDELDLAESSAGALAELLAEDAWNEE
jgi:metal-responsive CopG/Arc/MetJ family transcriptional regulator